MEFDLGADRWVKQHIQRTAGTISAARPPQAKHLPLWHAQGRMCSLCGRAFVTPENLN